MLETNSNKTIPATRIDSVSFEALYRAHWKKMFTVCCRYAQDTETAREIVQEVFQSLWERKDTLVIEGPPQNYLLRAARLKVIEKLRTHSKIQQHLAAVSYMQPQQANITDDQVAYNEQYKLLATGIEALPGKCRTVYQLSQQAVLTPAQIADQLNLSSKTVENYLSQAHQLLRKRMRTEGE